MAVTKRAKKPTAARPFTLTAVPPPLPPRTPTPWQAAWETMLESGRAIYRQELERLATELRTRILAGEFSGLEDEGRGGPKYCNLEMELTRSHPWAAPEREEGPHARLVLAVSAWPERYDRLLDASGLSGCDFVIASECLAHDTLAVAAERGWIAPLRDLKRDDPYRLRVKL